jgi:O-acetyl-ADP-ribose deacetylase (regulator of RNase III)
MLYIEYGSIFDSKCDLLILPCSSVGTITNWVRQEVDDHNLPRLDREIPYGKVLFYDVYQQYEKSNYIGYASSVEGTIVESSKEGIISVLKEVVEFCKNNNCTIVNIPILGTGAGGLDYSEVIKWYMEEINNTKYEFHAYIPELNIYEMYKISNKKAIENTLKFTNPRVFISYCQKDVKIGEWVLDLANKLRQNGVDARLDKYHLKPGIDLPQWMTNEIVKAQKVLLICDRHYAERADIRKAGVGWETMIIQGDMLTQGDSSQKYIAIACDGFR